MNQKLLAQGLKISGVDINGPLVGISSIGDVVNKVLNFFVFPVAGIILLFVFIWGGYDFILSRGSPEKVKSAWAKFTTGIIGFLILVFAYFFVRLISKIFGINSGIF